MTTHTPDTAESARNSLATSTPGKVTLRSLRKVYGDDKRATPAVQDVDLDIQPGEFITLLGPSGCGKTTTLRMIAGFETPTAGEIRLDDDLINKVAPNKRPMAMVFQSYALYPHLSVFDNVAYGLKLKKLPKERVVEEVETALTSMNLGPYRDRGPHQMSGGQQQRVALARALVMRPKVLLSTSRCPTSTPSCGSDARRDPSPPTPPRHHDDLRHARPGRGHDDVGRIVVMNVGVIEQVDTPQEIYRHPASVFVADFIGRANFLDVDVHALTEDGAEVGVLGKRWTVGKHRAVAAGDAVTLMVRPESVRLTATEAREVGGSVGRVLSSMFYGQAIEYDIETEAGNLVVSVADPHAHETFSQGDFLDVGFEAGRAWLMPVATDGS